MNISSSRTEIMATIDAFSEAFINQLSNLELDNKSSVVKFCIATVFEYPASYLISKDNVANLVKYVFSNTIIRQFVIDLTTDFIFRTGISSERLVDITRPLAAAISLHSDNGNRDNETCIPENILSTSSTVNELQKVLTDNKWLITIIFIKLYSYNLMKTNNIKIEA